MKFLIRFSILLVFFFSYSAGAQGILSRVPLKNISAVLTINGKVLNSRMTQEDLNKLPFIQEMLRSTLKVGDTIPVRLDMLGINLKDKSVFYIEHTDSAVFSNFIFPIEDAEKFKQLQSQKDSVKTDEFGNYYVQHYSSVLAWNKEIAVFVSAEVEDEYRYSDYSNVVVDSAAVYEEDTEDDAVYDVVPSDTMYTNPDQPSFNDTDTISAYDYEPYDEYEDEAYYEELKEVKEAEIPEEYIAKELPPSLGLILSINQYKRILAGNPAQSISQNPRFAKHQDEHSDIIFWAGLEKDYLLSMMKKSLGSYFYQYALPINSPVYSADNYVVAKLKFAKSTIHADLITYVDKRLSKRYKKMYRAHVSKKMIRLVKGDNLFGFVGSAMNSKAVLEQTPEIWKDYLEMLPYTHDIANELVDLIFLFVDKKAIAKLYKGDMLLAFTGMVSKEVPYTSFEYDSSFTMVPVEKSRIQTYPEFVYMYSTGDPQSTKKFFDIFYKKGLLKMDTKERYYYSSPFMDKIPFQLYFVVKKNAVFMCNSEEQLDIILRNKNKTKLKSEYTKMIYKNSFSLFADMSRVINTIQSSEDSIAGPEMFIARKYAGKLVMTGKGIKGNAMATKMELSSPSEFSNSMEAVCAIVNDAFLNEKVEKLAEPVVKTVELDGTEALYSVADFINGDFYQENPETYVSINTYGTGSAMEDFSKGYLDIAQTARPISAKEDSVCVLNKVEYIEIPVAYDAISFIVNAENTWMKDITIEELKLLWSPESKGKITKWNQIRKEWPNEVILLYGFGNSSAYYNYLASAVGKEFKLRTDYTIESDNELLINWVGKNKFAFGFVRNSSYLSLKTKVKSLRVDDLKIQNGKGAVELTVENIQNSTYQPFSRALYLYVNKASLEREDVKKYISYYLENVENVLAKSDCIPLESTVYKHGKSRFENRITGSEWLKAGMQGKRKLSEVYK